MSERVQIEVEGETVQRRGGILGFLLMLPGLGFIAFGIAIMIWPKLLIYLVGAVFILLGLGLSFAARKVGTLRRKAADFSATFRGPL